MKMEIISVLGLNQMFEDEVYWGEPFLANESDAKT
jgi:hypothetical protein